MKRVLLCGLAALALTGAGVRAEEKPAACPVSGKMVTVTEKSPRVLVNGTAVYFCCANCPKAFAKSPEKFLKSAGSCPVQGTPAVLDPNMRVVINNGLYYFCCPGCPDEFNNAPEKAVRRLVDPVTGKEFELRAGAPAAEYEGQRYFFAGPESKAAFEKEPQKYAVVYGK